MNNVWKFIFFMGLYSAKALFYKDRKEEQRALKECVEEISTKCSKSISYAIALEDENARLNRQFKKCKSK